jgi:hypothetical protein
MGMRTIAAAALLVTGALVSVAPGGAPMGLPTAYVGEGRWGLGAEYGYGQMDLETSGTVTDNLAGFPWDQDFRIDGLKSNMVFGTVAYGVTDNWDIFVRLGAADGRGAIVVPPSSLTAAERQDDYDGSFGFAGGLGTRITLYHTDWWSIGGLVQGTWFHPGDSDFTITDPWQPDESWVGQAELSYWQVQASLAAAFRVDTWRFWLGPFVQFTQGDLDFDGQAELAGNTDTLTWCSSIKDSLQVGGHFGAHWEICSQFNLWLEGQVTGDSWMVGIGAVVVPEKAFEI